MLGGTLPNGLMSIRIPISLEKSILLGIRRKGATGLRAYLFVPIMTIHPQVPASTCSSSSIRGKGSYSYRPFRGRGARKK